MKEVEYAQCVVGLHIYLSCKLYDELQDSYKELWGYEEVQIAYKIYHYGHNEYVSVKVILDIIIWLMFWW